MLTPKVGGRHDDAFTGIFVAHTWIHIPILHEM